MKRKMIVIIVAALAFFACEQPAGQKKEDPKQDPRGPGREDSRTITGIDIEVPDMLIYAKGQAFNPAGLAVKWTYNDGSTEPLSQGTWTCTTPDTSSAGVKIVYVRAGAYEKLFSVYVRNDTKVLTSITITTPPSKTNFDFGEELSTTGMRVQGAFYDSVAETTTSETISAYKVTGYNKINRGTQTLNVSVNGVAPAQYNVTVTIPASAQLSAAVKQTSSAMHFLKGQPFKVPKDIAVTLVTPYITTGFNASQLDVGDFSGYDSSIAGEQTVTLTLDYKTTDFTLITLDSEPEVYFDYGYMRLPSDPTGIGAGEGKFYTRPNEPLVLSVVRFLIGYDDNNAPLPVSYTWSVTEAAGAYSTPSGTTGEYFGFTPSAAGTYRIKASVTGRSFINGQTITKEAETDVVCYTGTVATSKTFPDAPGMRHFAPGQFTMAGTGLGWSCGAQGGYWVWRVPHQQSYRIEGNAFGTWNEPGVVWVMEDNNGNNIPDEMWYELSGGEDNTNPSQITRRYAVKYFHASGETLNEFGQLIAPIPWVDGKGRSGSLRGGWPRLWGVADTEDWVMYTGTALRDSGEIAIGEYGSLAACYDYVDAIASTFPISRARKADGSPVVLTNVRFIKVQTAKFLYGGIFGEVSTEVGIADGLGRTTDFPFPSEL